MKIQIERTYVESLVRVFPDLAGLQDQLRFGDRAEIPVGQLSRLHLDHLAGLYAAAGPDMRGPLAQLATLQQAMNDDGVRFAPGELEQAVPAIARFLVQDAQRGWLFAASVTGKPLPYVLTRLDYTPASNDESGKVTLELKANAKASLAVVTLRISESDTVGRRPHGGGNLCRQGLSEGNPGADRSLRCERRALFRVA